MLNNRAESLNLLLLAKDLYIIILYNILCYWVIQSNMKDRISATVDERTIKLLGSLIKNRKYRNKSHVIEKAIEILWEKENDKNKK